MSPILNPAAPAFVPAWMADSYAYDEEHLTAQEIEELEACDWWCEMMMRCDELEHDHMVALALMHAPAQKLTEIEKRAHVQSGAKEGSGRGHSGAPRRSNSGKQTRQGRVRSNGALFQPQRAH